MHPVRTLAHGSLGKPLAAHCWLHTAAVLPLLLHNVERKAYVALVNGRHISRPQALQLPAFTNRCHGRREDNSQSLLPVVGVH